MIVLAFRLTFSATILAVLLAWGSLTLADTNVQIADGLVAHDVYISPPLQTTSHVVPGDAARLRAMVARASRQGVEEKIALVSHYPGHLAGPTDAANNLQIYLGFSGVLVLVSPHGMGVTSDFFSPQQAQEVIRQTQSLCRKSYAACAIAAASKSIALVKASQQATHHNVLVFWGVTVAAFLAALIMLAAYTVNRRPSSLSLPEEEREAEQGPTLAGRGT